MLFIIALTPLLASLVLAHPREETKICKDYVLSVTVTSGNYVWGLPTLETDYDVTTFTANLSRWDANITFHPISGFSPNVTAGYKIAGTFCAPTKGDSKTVLLASHGLGFNRNYWSPEIQPEKYSFVDFAISRGYSVFFYDRLGVSGSSVISGYVNQVSIQVAILEQLVEQIRAGTFSSKPNNVVLVGHSFGSVISNALLVSKPGLVDAAVLTGISYKVPDTSVAFEAWQPRLARLQSPGRWRQLDGGYTTWVDIFASVNVFFKYPVYDKKIVEYSEATKQPFALMEVISLSITDLHSPKFAGPVLVISGENDLVFCNGDCVPILNAPAVERFNASKNLEVYVQPGSGHAINYSLNATGAYGVITNFLTANGL
ncbi:Alpha/Beta hydrolase protein [Rhexocercosporidium sp. MPI-PUGE-AT-0058]|nr:Alpha/Beta hydrolase protein [Rhexocercosporidium sp. MPI-PUGE-AT-0058]